MSSSFFGTALTLLETPWKEELELLRHSTDMRFEGSQMRQAYNAVKSCDW